MDSLESVDESEGIDSGQGVFVAADIRYRCT